MNGPLIAALSAGAVFAAMGVAIFLWGRSYRVRDRAIGGWPKAPGVVVSSRYAASTGTTRDAQGYDVTSTSFVPAVSFQYEVAGTTYTGTKVTRAVEPTSDGAKVKAIIDRYPAGAKVEVLVDPKDPATAYLEVGTSGGAMFLMVFGGFFAAMGFGALALVALTR
ncbi:MAG: hypothetical protein JWM10_2205 [Myxococcaceae bacterium]|nr:hypothetical protein [Myxococcaceae bacterium]